MKKGEGKSGVSNVLGVRYALLSHASATALRSCYVLRVGLRCAKPMLRLVAAVYSAAAQVLVVAYE